MNGSIDICLKENKIHDMIMPSQIIKTLYVLYLSGQF